MQHIPLTTESMTIQVVVVAGRPLLCRHLQHDWVGTMAELDWIELLYNSFLSFTDTATIDFL